jgi:methylmalonyl-CoA mutase cobalamin-binding subunit
MSADSTRPLPSGAELLERGRALAKTWQVEPGPFLKHRGVACEADFKRQAQASGSITQHAQIGFRDLARSCETYAEVYGRCLAKEVTVDRYGITLDWSMGYAKADRTTDLMGTGMLLEGPEDFVKLAHSAPVAPHFGDFIMGFPAAVENTQAALAAGSTSVGNLGQLYTFRLPGDNDGIAATEATVVALGLVAAQPVEVLVHSNLDDGFAAVFTDLSSALGMVLTEKYIVEDLIGAHLSHCYGHHFSDPLRRHAFHKALGRVSKSPGTMVYGNTVSYRGNDAQNYAALAAYLAVDILGQRIAPSGHAINPVPVTENSRIPDIDEIVDAQLFAGRLVERSQGFETMIDPEESDRIAELMIEGGKRFKENLLKGLEEDGVDTADPFRMFLAIRRLGGKKLEERFGAGTSEAALPRGRRPVVAGSLLEEIRHMSVKHMARVAPEAKAKLAASGVRVLTATTDVHEHGKLLIDNMFRDLGVTVVDGGVSVDAIDIARAVKTANVDAIALSTYNGVALSYLRALKQTLAEAGLTVPILIGGRLNQVPQGSNTSLPVDVSSELEAEGAIVCTEVEDAVPALIQAAQQRAKVAPGLQ